MLSPSIMMRVGVTMVYVSPAAVVDTTNPAAARSKVTAIAITRFRRTEGLAIMSTSSPW